MIQINEHSIGLELKRLFSKSILNYNDINFEDANVFKKVLDIFIFDYQRYFVAEPTINLENVLSRTELVGILLYRISREYYILKNEYIAQQYALLGRFLSGFEIYYSATIGKGLKINHGLGTVIGARVTIGENALIHQGVTFGDKNGGRPTLLNNVTVFAGACILGNITVGNNAVIAANCVCFINVPDDNYAIGVPAKLINKH